MIRRFSLFSYLLTAILICSSVIFALTVRSNNRYCIRTLMKSQEDKYTALIRVSAGQMNLQLQSIEEMVLRNTLYFAESMPKSSEEMTAIINQSLQAHPALFGMEIIYTEKGRRKLPGGVSPVAYGWRSGDSIQVTTERNIENDYQAEWFQEPSRTKTAVWSEPYLDPVPQTLMLTYSYPKLDADGDVEAIFTGDISLEWIEPCLLSLPLGQKGYPVLISKNGTFIESVNPAWKMQTLQKLAEKSPPELKKVIDVTIKEIQKPSGFYPYLWEGEYIRFYHQILPKTGWVIGCMIPEKEVTDVISQMMVFSSILGGIGLILLTFVAWGIARSVARPIRALSDAADELARGIFETELPSSNGKSEIARLVRSFDLMRTDLKRYIRDVTDAARAKERISAELSLAHSIQLGMVPKNFDPPKKFGIDVYAAMEPALSVGGDLYDFAMLDDNHFYFCVGDVSGKGVPASLFMAVGKALIKSTMLALRNPAEVLTRVNEELMAHNQETLFITTLCGILDLKTGTIQYANAGHMPPILITPEGDASYPEIEPGFPLALIDGMKYENKTLQLLPEGTMFLYTDGATDAENINAKYFGSTQLLKTVQSITFEDTQKTVIDVMAAIHQFAQGAKQSDDITLLAYTWHKD